MDNSGHDKWLIIQDSKGGTAFVPFLTADGQSAGNGLRVAMLTCQRCGFVRMHNLDTLREFMDGMTDER